MEPVWVVVGRGVSPTSAKAVSRRSFPVVWLPLSMVNSCPARSYLHVKSKRRWSEASYSMARLAWGRIARLHSRITACAELAGFMISSGKVDSASLDEISLIYDPVSLGALSVPLVNIRFWLDGLVSACVIASEGAQAA